MLRMVSKEINYSITDVEEGDKSGGATPENGPVLRASKVTKVTTGSHSEGIIRVYAIVPSGAK